MKRSPAQFFELVFTGIGIACIAGVIISPSSWVAGPLGIIAILIGFAFFSRNMEG